MYKGINMEEAEYIGRKRVTVSKTKTLTKKGTSAWRSIGVMNFPEEKPGTIMYVKETPDGFVIEYTDNGGFMRKVRKASKQTVITIGMFVEKTSEYECYRTANGYKMVYSPEVKLGTGYNVISIHIKQYGRKRYGYINIPKVHIRLIAQGRENCTLIIKETYSPELKMTIEVATRNIHSDPDARYVKYDEKKCTNCTITIPKRMIDKIGLKDNDKLILYKRYEKLCIIRG